jgi:hypothetical protein
VASAIQGVPLRRDFALEGRPIVYPSAFIRRAEGVDGEPPVTAYQKALIPLPLGSSLTCFFLGTSLQPRLVALSSQYR